MATAGALTMANFAPNLPPLEKAFPPSPGSERTRPPAQPPGDWRQWVDSAAKFIADHPGASLASALILGAAVAWWIKRR
jgi:hypothetical protein